jgi:hypothetical protein
MTVVELITAMSVLSLLVALTGEAFHYVGQATEQVETCLHANEKILALEGQLRRDLANCDSDGMLVITDEAMDGNRLRPAMLMLTVTGRYLSQFPGGAVAGAAVIVYELAQPAATLPRPGRVLCRYVYLLAGGGGAPRTLQDIDLQGKADGCLNSVAWSDVLGESLSDLTAKAAKVPTMKDANSLPNTYFGPMMESRPLNLRPAAAGDVLQLWPVMFSGCQSITWEYCDGLNADGRTPTVGAAQWFNAGSPATANRNPAGGQLVRFPWLNTWIAAWYGRNNAIRPRRIRVTVTLCGATPESPGQTYEIEASLRK